jgi:hypothetical protein
MLALQLLQKRDYKAALLKVGESRRWPEHLGVGKPYQDMINDDLTNNIEKMIRQSTKDRQNDQIKIDSFTREIDNKF